MKNLFCLRRNYKPQNSLRPFVFLILFILVAVFVAGCDKETPLSLDQQTEAQQNLAKASAANALQAVAAPVVTTVTDLGVVAHPPSVLVRDGGSTTLVAGKVLWLFGDTIFKPGYVAVDGAKYRSNTAALSIPATPLAVSEPLDANGTPYQAIPFTVAEQAYNDSTGKTDDRIALWPGGMVPEKNGKGLAFFLKIQIKPGILNYQPAGVGTAHFAAGKTTAQRDPNLLFSATEPQFSRAFLYNGMVYLYGKLPTGSFLPYGVARAPQKKATNRSAYQFWNGSAWVTDVNQAVAVMYGIPGSVTVSYNAYLKTFIAIHSQAFSDKVVFRTAASPEGPWSSATDLFTGMPSSSNNYAGQEHPELAKNNGKIIYVSYFNPQGFLQGELRLVEVTFQ